jgi:hypothetical protein
LNGAAAARVVFASASEAIQGLAALRLAALAHPVATQPLDRHASLAATATNLAQSYAFPLVSNIASSKDSLALRPDHITNWKA